MSYPAFPKIPRFNRTISVTEKIDGTNGQILVSRFHAIPGEKFSSDDVKPLAQVGELYAYAGSRNRWLSTSKDNFGFAKWVDEQKPEPALATAIIEQPTQQKPKKARQHASHHHIGTGNGTAVDG